MDPAEMKEHALAILDQPLTGRFLQSGRYSDRFKTITPRLLYYLIIESQNFQGSQVLKQFWYVLGPCNEKLRENVESLNEQAFVSADHSFEILFRELDPVDVNFEPVLKMAEEFFTHLGVAIMNPGGPKSGSGSTFSVNEIVNEKTEKLLEQVKESGRSGARNQEALKQLSFRRDGDLCQIARIPFRFVDPLGALPVLAHIIPHAVHGKSDTLKCISVFAGVAAAEEISRHLNEIGNVVNFEMTVHALFDRLEWGIEATEEGGKVKYIFRTIPLHPQRLAPYPIKLKDGDEIHFGQGREGTQLTNPIPILCNLQLAVARVMRMSAAADIILQWKDDADDQGFSHLFIASEEFCDMLDAKLYLSGKAGLV